MAKRNSADERLKELLPPQDGVEPPPYGLVEDLILERQRLYATSAATTASQAASANTRSGNWATGAGESARRSKTLRGREINARRMLLRDPIVPKNYEKTTIKVRAGSSLLGDVALRVPAVLSAKPYQARCQPLDDDAESLAAATTKEEFLHAFLFGVDGERATVDVGRTSVWRDFGDNIFNQGEGAYLLTCRRDRWSTSNGHPQRDAFQDDGEDVPASRRRTGAQKYQKAAEYFRKSVCPFVLENVHPQMVHVGSDDDGVEDEAIIVARRPWRVTLAQYGLKPTTARYGADGQRVISGQTGNYLAGPDGLGQPYPMNDLPSGQYQPNGVEVVSYFCSARRAQALGLVDGDDPDRGVWAYYVDGVCVDYGPLWGPAWHPLPLFWTPGLSTAIPDENFRGIPGLMYLLELADLLDQIFTMEVNVAFWGSFPIVVEEDRAGGGVGATGLPEDVLANPESIQMPVGGSKEVRTLEPGRFYPVPPGRTWRYLVFPPESSAHLDKLYERVRELFDLMGVPGVFRGSGGSSQAGYAIAQLMIAAKSVYDPIIDNSSALATRAAKYLLWQIWRRFPEGVSVFAGGGKKTGRGQDAGWLTITPADIAPDCPKGQAGKGTPFLQLAVRAEPLMPQDEFQLEQRGVNAVQAGMVDLDTAREKYFNDPSPEKTAARILADKAQQHPVAVANATYRMLVRSGALSPMVAMKSYAKELGLDPQDVLGQLLTAGVLSPEQAQQIQQQQAQEQAMQMQQQQQAQAQQAIAAGGMPPGQEPVPGMPGPPGVPQAPVPPQAPQGPPIQMGTREGMAAPGVPTQQPSIAARQSAMLAA